jgi:hypothetical protein
MLQGLVGEQVAVEAVGRFARRASVSVLSVTGTNFTVACRAVVDITFFKTWHIVKQSVYARQHLLVDKGEFASGTVGGNLAYAGPALRT